jgi:hypothetical protein
MTPLSLVPEQAKHLGISYADLVEAIIAEALAAEGGPAVSADDQARRQKRPQGRSAQGKARKVRSAKAADRLGARQR